MTLPQFYIDDLIKRAITEDINYIDVTTDYLLDDAHTSTAVFLAKDTGVLAGIDIALRVFELMDDTLTFTVSKKDGDEVKKGDIIATVQGKTKSILKSERTALNLVQHMSGIATATHKCVELTKGTRASIVETRKTLPGLRPIQKYAVVAGGGRNHRYNLSDAAMLKDNHIDAYGSLTNAVNALRAKTGHMVKIEVEVDSLELLEEALNVKADIIMLDNMSYEQMAEAVKITDGRALLEASGNITLENIAEVAKTGVDIISLGALTHSVKAFDISLKIKTDKQ
ncbi:carboxylating nicotinate-nucleotide diphosphorylase [Fumia xinanensis]|uniref:Probable nicotinate-nucleotide pyrophosphorylase [carboxylating] n=1 Tax=Fumia xinanensis TaxID=2763659 RepID=A0A926E5J4_9FIRM|nr:carboxylating nicotinate-nucleotide diphosphorylase [Fumia xinanensis]MBC8559940.1 carboxylating nicotinate-nucleotide diphosphorylase [Fumia xinanensis]